MQTWKAYTAIIAAVALAVVGQSLHSQHAQTPKNAVARAAEARSVVGQARAAALNINNDFQRGLVLDQIGAAEAKVGDLNAAAEIAALAYPHTMATLTAIGEQIAKSNDLGKMQSIVPKLKGDESSTIFAVIARCHAEKANIAEALRTTELIQAPEVRSEALKWVAQEQAKNGDYPNARKTLVLANAAYPAQSSSSDDIELIIASGQLYRGETQAARATLASVKSADTRSFAMISDAGELLEKGDKAAAGLWLDDGLRGLSEASKDDFFRYFAIPIQVKLGRRELGMQAAGALSPNMRVKGYTAVAVACAESKDVAGVNSAVEKMRLAAAAHEGGLSPEFETKMMVLNVTAALIDYGEFEAASRLLSSVEEHLDDVASKMSIAPQAQLYRVVLLAEQGDFDRARSLAMTMRPGSIHFSRGTALRTVAVLQTRKNGIASSQSWAAVLKDAEDRAYALLGIAQTLLEIDDVKLPYNAILLH